MRLGFCTTTLKLKGPFYVGTFIEVKLNMYTRLKGISTQRRYNGVEKVDLYAVISYLSDKNEFISDNQTKDVVMKFQQVPIYP